VRDGDVLKSTNSKPEFEKPETLQHAMKAQEREIKVNPYLFLNPGAVWSLVSKATPSPLYLPNSAPYLLQELHSLLADIPSSHTD
jgi:hypothetical protein